MVALVWASIAAALLGSLALQIARMSRFVRRMPPLDNARLNSQLDELKLELGSRRDVGLRLAGSGEMPFTWGLLRAVIALPAEARARKDSRSRAVLGHELAHVARCNVAMILLARITCALHWFNPLAWRLHRRQRLESEHACDHVALAPGMRPADHAENLLETASAASGTRDLATIMAAKTQLEGRTMAISISNDNASERGLPHSLPWSLVSDSCCPSRAPDGRVALRASRPWPTPTPRTSFGGSSS